MSCNLLEFPMNRVFTLSFDVIHHLVMSHCVLILVIILGDTKFDVGGIVLDGFFMGFDDVFDGVLLHLS